MCFLPILKGILLVGERSSFGYDPVDAFETTDWFSLGNSSSDPARSNLEASPKSKKSRQLNSCQTQFGMKVEVWGTTSHPYFSIDGDFKSTMDFSGGQRTPIRHRVNVDLWGVAFLILKGSNTLKILPWLAAILPFRLSDCCFVCFFGMLFGPSGAPVLGKCYQMVFRLRHGPSALLERCPRESSESGRRL